MNLGQLLVLEAQRAETSLDSWISSEEVSLGAHCLQEAAVFSSAYKNGDCVLEVSEKNRL